MARAPCLFELPNIFYWVAPGTRSGMIALLRRPCVITPLLFAGPHLLHSPRAVLCSAFGAYMVEWQGTLLTS